MPETMQAIVKSHPGPGVEVRDVPIPPFGPADVLVRVEAASVCGTDLHIYEWDDWAQSRIKTPLIPGHEFCGFVAEVGRDVTAVKPGDFVSAEMHVACGKCLQCRIGEAHICQNVKIIGVDADGAFAEYVVIPESNIWDLDASIPREYASILDPHRSRGRNRRAQRRYRRLRPNRTFCHRRCPRLRRFDDLCSRGEQASSGTGPRHGSRCRARPIRG